MNTAIESMRLNLAKGRLEGAQANRHQAELRRKIWGEEARRILLQRPHLLHSIPRLAELVEQRCNSKGIPHSSAGTIYNFLIANNRAALREPLEISIPQARGVEISESERE